VLARIIAVVVPNRAETAVLSGCNTGENYSLMNPLTQIRRISARNAP
jgi:hypothetical protein